MKDYIPKDIEQEVLENWIKSNIYTVKSPKKAFSMVIPPPNVTGSLHIGHALNITIQDIVARFKRMQGYDVVWVPGFDHAGIATQFVVERDLSKENKSRLEIGREEFLKRVWQWVYKSRDNIKNQVKRLGASVDWSRERFTMDEGFSRAVRYAFKKLYEEGLIKKTHTL
jgi:Valyl-tRNA synthetase